nr:reverse transcriptase domain-containing protein [Tanacetum cinerariifolium]
MTATLKYRDVPNDDIKLILFPYSLEGAARVWDNVSKTDYRIDKLADQISNLVEIVNKQVSALAKAVEKTYVTSGGAHSYYECISTDIPNNQIPPSVPNEFLNYMKSNEIMIKSMQNQINVLRGDFNKQEENLRRNLNNDMRSILGSFFQNQPSTSGTLPINTMPNQKGEMKAITTRSGLAYEGPSIPTNSPLKKANEKNTEEILDKEHSNSSGSTAQIQPPVVPILISKPDVTRTQSKPTIPYPSRLNDQKLREKATNQMGKFFKIFHDLHFDISFADALLLMPKFASTIKSLLANKDKLFELAKVPLNENCSAMLMKKLPEKLGDPGVAEDVFVKVGKFYFPTDFVVVDFEADPRVSLILGRSFLRIGRALIDIYGGEITFKVNDESITFNLNQTMRYSSIYDDNSVNRVDVIDIACEEFVHDVLDFQYNPKSSSPTLVFDALVTESDSSKEPVVKSSSPTLTPFGENPFQLPSMDLKLAKESKAKSSVEEPHGLELKELPSHLEYAFLEDSNKLPVIIAKNLKDVKKEALINVLKSHKRAIAWKISDIKGIDPRFFTHKILMKDYYKLAVKSQRRVNPKIYDVIKKEVIKLFDVVLGQRKLKHFQPIHYASKKMIEAQIHYTTTKKEMLAVVYAFEKFRPYLVLSKSIVYTDHSALKYFLNKQDAKPRLLRWVLLLHEFDIIILDKKGSENLAPDHLSRLENPHQDVLENKDINEKFSLDTLGSLNSHSTPWFGDIVNFHARNFIKKGLTSQQKKKFFKDVLKSSKLAMRDLLGAIMVPISQQRRKMRCLRTVSKFVRYSIYESNDQVWGNTSASHCLSSSGQVEVSNRELKRILERTVGENCASWSDKLDDALWAFRTAYKTPIGCTPYKLVYGKSCHLPIELEHRAYWALKHVNFDLKTASDHRKLQLNELSELRDQAYTNSVIYKERTKKLHDSKIKNHIFNVGDQVLLFNPFLKIFSRKLKTRWFGPFTITHVFPYGTIELSQPNGPNFKVNGHRVKHYFGGDIPTNVALNLYTFPMDN